MENMNTQFQAFESVLKDLESDLGREYVILALKKISDQQMLFIDFSSFPLQNEPILLVLDTCVREIEEFLFESHLAVDSSVRLKELISGFLGKV